MKPVPYDAYIINHFLHHLRGLSPLWLAEPESRHFLEDLGFLKYILRPVLGSALKTVYQTTGRVTLHEQGEGLRPRFTQTVAQELQGNGVVGIFPTGTLYSQRIRFGFIFISCGNKQGTEGVPIVPIKIDRHSTPQPAKFRLQIKPTIYPIFEEDQPSLKELKSYREQLGNSFTT